MNANVNLTVEEIAKVVDGKLYGNSNIVVKNISRIENSKPNDLSFIFDSSYQKYIETSEASCFLIPENISFSSIENKAFIVCRDPHFALLELLNYIVKIKSEETTTSIHNTAVVDKTAKIGDKAVINANCYIGKNCVIGNNVILHPNVVLYDNVEVGSNSIINSNVVCYDDTVIGKNCIIHSGAVIGADGFGFYENKDGSYKKIPQLGNVHIGDNVEIGANAAIDRALLDSTIISDGVKIDNLVHIAHNCTIGKNSAMAAQVGIAGSTKIGERNRFAGQVGISGHIEIGDDVFIAAQSGVSKSIKESGMYFGSPAKDKAKAYKIEACIRSLPEIIKDIEKLKKEKIIK